MAAALSAPNSIMGEEILSAIILVTSILSALGAAWMIMSFIVGNLSCANVISLRNISLICAWIDSLSHHYEPFVISWSWVSKPFRVCFLVVGLLRTKTSKIGLGISDFLMALNFILSTSMNISGRKIWSEPLQGFCSFNGFMTQVFVIQSTSFLLATYSSIIELRTSR